MAGAVELEANQVDHDIGPKISNTRAECAGLLLGFAVDDQLLDRLPGRVRLIRATPASTERDNLVPGLDQAWDEIRSDMAGGADNHYPHHLLRGIDDSTEISLRLVVA